MPDLGPDYPPAGTTLPVLLTRYLESIEVALYTHPITVCPPPAYESIIQPTSPDANPHSIVSIAGLPVPVGPGLTARRLAYRFMFPHSSQAFDVIGWFAFCTLRDGSKVVIMVRPFPTPITIGGPPPPPPALPVTQLILQPTFTVAQGIGAGGASVLDTDAQVGLSYGGRMAFVFRGEQRRALRSLTRILAKIATWDANIANLSPRSLLARYPILFNVPSPLQETAGPPPTYYTGDWCAHQVAIQALADLALTAPSTPP